MTENDKPKIKRRSVVAIEEALEAKAAKLQAELDESRAINERLTYRLGGILEALEVVKAEPGTEDA